MYVECSSSTLERQGQDCTIRTTQKTKRNCHWQAQDERGRPLAEQRNRERCSQASSCGEVEPPSDYLLKLRLDGPVHRASLPREHRAIQVERVTVSVTPTCHSAGDGATQSAARPRSSRCTALGWKTRGCRA